MRGHMCLQWAMAKRKNVDFGVAVRELRIADGVPQAVLAAHVGVDVSTIRRIESCSVRVYLDTAIRIADALGVKLSQLVGDQ